MKKSKSIIMYLSLITIFTLAFLTGAKFAQVQIIKSEERMAFLSEAKGLKYVYTPSSIDMTLLEFLGIID